MSIPTLYLWFPGNAREALTFYGETFGGDVQLHTYSEFSRTDGPEDAIAHGEVGAPSLSSALTLPGTNAPSRCTALRSRCWEPRMARP